MARKRDYAAEYAKRIARGLAKGRTRQQSRGHVEKEHVVRAEREREEQGISGQELNSVRNWYSKSFNPRGHDEKPDIDDVIEFARSNGYEAFKQYRDTWNAARRTYIRELKDGTYASRGEPYLNMLNDTAGTPDVPWLYYH